jgi:hypothetical protein
VEGVPVPVVVLVAEARFRKVDFLVEEVEEVDEEEEEEVFNRR